MDVPTERIEQLIGRRMTAAERQVAESFRHCFENTVRQASLLTARARFLLARAAVHDAAEEAKAATVAYGEALRAAFEAGQDVEDFLRDLDS